MIPRQTGLPGEEADMHKFLALVFLLACLLVTAAESRADQFFMVTKDSLLFSNSGFLIRIVETGSPGTTFFAFEYENMIQTYAERPDGSQTWEVLDGRQFLCRAWAMGVGNVWRFLDDEVTGERRTAEVVSTGNVVVGAGSFQAWRVDIALDSTPDTVQESVWFAATVGIVKQVDWTGGVAVGRSELQAFSVTGFGYFPLEVDNAWQYTDLSVPGALGTLGALKTQYRH
jgi:hypothetical protein